MLVLVLLVALLERSHPDLHPPKSKLLWRVSAAKSTLLNGASAKGLGFW